MLQQFDVVKGAHCWFKLPHLGLKMRLQLVNGRKNLLFERFPCFAILVSKLVYFDLVAGDVFRSCIHVFFYLRFDSFNAIIIFLPGEIHSFLNGLKPIQGAVQLHPKVVHFSLF